MPDFVPTPAQYADPEIVKRVLNKGEADAAAAPVLKAACQDATVLVNDRTGRVWCVDPDADPLTLTYDAPPGNILLVDDLADVTGVVVKVGGTVVDVGDYTWVYRPANPYMVGLYRHAYAVRLHTGTWADAALTAGRSPLGDVTLEGAVPATTTTPPGLIVQTVERVAVGLYDQRKSHYQHIATGSEEIGIAPPPDAVVNADALAVLGPFIHPRRKLGRP